MTHPHRLNPVGYLCFCSPSVEFNKECSPERKDCAVGTIFQYQWLVVFSQENLRVMIPYFNLPLKPKRLKECHQIKTDCTGNLLKSQHTQIRDSAFYL